MKSTDDRTQMIGLYYEGAFETIVCQTALRVGDRQSAEDIVQEAFLRLLTSESIVMEASLPGLVYRTVTNVLYDRWRRWKRAENYRRFTANDLDSCRDSADSSDRAAWNTAVAAVERAIIRLDDDSARIIRMNVFAGKKVSEIADETGIQYKKVENKLYAARKELRKSLRGYAF